MGKAWCRHIVSIPPDWTTQATQRIRVERFFEGWACWLLVSGRCITHVDAGRANQRNGKKLFKARVWASTTTKVYLFDFPS